MKLVSALPPVVAPRLEEVVRFLRAVDTVAVTEGCHDLNGSCCLGQAGDGCNHVDDRFCCQAGNRGGADVFDGPDQPWRQSGFDTDPLALEQRRPVRVVRAQDNQCVFQENCLPSRRTGAGGASDPVSNRATLAAIEARTCITAPAILICRFTCDGVHHRW